MKWMVRRDAVELAVKTARSATAHRPVLALLLLVVAAAPAAAQISLGAAVDLALRSNPKVRVAQADVNKARAALSQVRDAYVPSVEASGGEGTSTGVPLSVPVVFSLTSNSLVFNFAQKDNLRAARAGVEAASLSLTETRNQVAEDVIVTYMALNNAQQREAVLADELADANRLVAIVTDRLEAGQDTRLELLRAQRTAKQIELQRMQVQDQTATDSDHLARLIGLPGNALQTIPGSIPALPTVASLRTDLQEQNNDDSPGVQAAFANAHAKQETAFGLARYRWRPQMALGLNYSRISTNYNDYVDYYPGFKAKSADAASVGISITIPLFDRAHAAQARQAAADAAHAYYEALDARNVFREGRLKLAQGASELEVRTQLAELDRDVAQAELQSIETQLNSPASTSDGSKPELSPKDQQNARLQERSKMLEYLNTENELTRAQVNLMRQTGRLTGWVQTLAPAATTEILAKP